MNPFDLPPTTSPVSTEQPTPPTPEGPPRRGRGLLVAVVAAGLVGGGIVGISELVSADRSTVRTASSETSRSASFVAATGDDDAPTDPDDGSDGGSREGETAPSVDGRIVIDTGDGDPVVIDLGEGTIDGESFDRVLECVPFDLDLDAPPIDPERLDELFDEMPIDPERLDELFEGLPIDPEAFDLEELFEQFDDRLGDVGVLGGTHITIIGPDGVTIVDLGDGDGSVTITKQDGEVSVIAQGDAEVTELSDLGDVSGGLFEEWEPAELPEWELGEWFDDLEQCLADGAEE